MNLLLNYANKYMERMNILDVSLLKICLCSLGVMLGISVPKKNKRKVAVTAGILFAFTYAPLMTKFLGVVLEEAKKNDNAK